MILTKEVEIITNTSNIKYYENLGYNIPISYDERGMLVKRGKTITVKIKDLQKSSKVLIEMECDNCGEIFKIPYVQYRNLKEENKNLCHNCKKHKWHYDIGDIIKNDFINVTIIDRRINNSNQQYKIHCNKCGFNSEKYIPIKSRTKEYVEEYWVYYGNLITMKSCPCCGSFPTVIVKGINDIPTTDPWMVNYFIGGADEAEKYVSGSGEKIRLKCPDCNKDRIFQICLLKTSGYMPCDCRMQMSIPNKISYYVFKSLEKQLEYYEREYSPDWIHIYSDTIYKNMSYDNYFIINDKEYIVEMDGGLGHGNKQFKSQKQDVKGIQNDIIKDRVAKEHNITVIRVKCPDGNYHQTYINLLDSIKNIIDISSLDENYIMSNVHKNFIKIICEYYSKHSESLAMVEIAKHFNIHIHTLRDYLKFGNRYEWCNYVNNNTKMLLNVKPQVIKLYKNGFDQFEISDKLNIKYKTVLKYLHQEDLIPVTKYDNGKTVYVYTLNKEYITEYPSQNDLERRSLSDFGIELRSRSVSRVCTGERKQYKGYIFSSKRLD